MAYTIKRDGVEVIKVDNEFSVLAWFHKNHSFSMDHATKYEGYSVESDAMPAIEIDPATRPDLKEMRKEGARAHFVKQEIIAQAFDVEWLRTLIPFERDAVRKALESGDQHLNTLSLARWDRMHEIYGSTLAGKASAHRAGWAKEGRAWSMSDTVCLLKHVARYHYV